VIGAVPLLAAGCAVAFCGAVAGCSLLRTFSLRRGLLDRPNERSLHSTPVPRLGGVAIALATWLGLGTVHALQRSMPGKFEVAWLVTSSLVAALGLVDDLRPLRASARLLLQVACAVLFCLLAGIPRGISLVAPTMIVLPAAISFALWVFFVVAVLNLFNFMDGMDGLAGTQALGAALGIGGAFAVSHQLPYVALCAVLAAASAGFLVHNFPPAKIFMGDAGSTFLGFSFAALALIGADLEPGLPVSTFAFALAPFLLDGTLTLLRRVLKFEPIWKAHRTHLYQRAATAGRTHHDVLVAYALWIAAGAAAAVCAARGGRNALAVLALGALTALAAVLAWVWRLERAFAQSSPDSRIQATSSATAAVKST
jgi:UDP-N-acetylmuramyl pentapeptide phosphotransferase/UDP-N-acetylglucosamine-1-phosphate transferase